MKSELHHSGPFSPGWGRRGSQTLRLVGFLVAGLAAAAPAGAQSYSTLYSFSCGPNDGTSPASTLARDFAGNIYGTTTGGGLYGVGVIFELPVDGTETVLYSFAGPPADGDYPEYTSLSLDATGKLYGTTPFGGAYGNGGVFKLTPGGTETFFSFAAPKNGVEPFGGLALDSAGNLYGATFVGGLYHKGVVFKLTPADSETVLYTFSKLPGAQSPVGGLLRDGAGNLYGTAEYGGQHSAGAVFELSAAGKETVLHSFGEGPDGKNPFAGVVRDPAGNLYGSTEFGGTNSEGTAFEVTAADKARVLHNFTGTPDGATPLAGLARDSAGNLYGTTVYGGSGPCNDGVGVGCGVIFEVTPRETESVLYSFAGTPTDGEYPLAGLLRDAAGNLYGTTSAGGTYGCGTVFKYTP